MSTHNFISRTRKDVCWPLKVSVPVLGALLMTLLCLLSPTVLVYAASAQRLAAPPPQNLAHAGVSVVRLVVTYTGSSTAPSNAGTPAQFQCTGLGVIVASWMPSGSTSAVNNLILTDGILVQKDAAKCVTPASQLPKNTTFALSSITVYLSTAFNNKHGVAITTSTPLDVRCNDTKTCSDSFALFAVHTDGVNPFISTTTNNTVQGAGTGIELAKSATTLSRTGLPAFSSTKQDPNYASTAKSYVTPVLNKSTSAEAGMPQVDATGNLLGVQLMSGGNAQPTDLHAFVTSQHEWSAQQLPESNEVKSDWDIGMTDFYKGKAFFPDANTAFNNAIKANPQFQGAQSFANATQTPPQPTMRIPVIGVRFPTSWLPFILGGVGVLVLLIVLMVVLLFLRNRRVQKEYQEAAQLSESMIKEERLRQQQSNYAEQQTIPSHQQPFGRAASPEPLILGVGQPLPQVEQPPVQALPPAYPQGMPAQQQPVQADIVASNMPLPNGQDMALQQASQPPTAPLQRPHSIADMPTLVPMNNTVQGPIPQQSPANLHCPVCNGLVSQTTDMCPTCGTPLQFNGAQMVTRTVANYGQNEATLFQTMGDQTLTQAPSNSAAFVSNGQIPPPVYQQGLGQRLGFFAGTRTNPGIKRKHKPNEDSLFAAQGMRSMQNTMQPFGLFVVADGMGGHANGQDASRLAIQTIVDYMLPLLVSHPEMSGDDLRKLLVEGVQRANQAVHQHNMEQRADMGTTMTAALIVDTIAYIANVGDSRTYLYREPYGLVKITQDHSVVASLVDAGIIKPDDIYTHPKRNQIYRSLGEKPNVDVDSFMQELIPNDKLLLCSDGLWDMVRDPNIAAVLKQQGSDPGTTGDGLIQAALAGGGEDNVSVIVVQIVEPSGDRQGLQLGVQLLAKPDTLNMPSVPQL